MSDNADDGGLTMPDDLDTTSEDSDDETSYDDPINHLGNHGLFPTDISQPNPEFSNLTLNDTLEIRSISLPNDQVPYVEWPRSSRDQKEDKNTIWFEEMSVKNALSDCVAQQLVHSGDVGDLDVTINRFHAYEQDNLLGFLDVSVNDVMTIKGAKLMVTDGEKWISWPAEQDDEGNWYDLFSTPDSLDARLIEQIEKNHS